GMWANAVTDLVQGIVMVAGILLLGVVFVQMGGMERIAELPRAQLSLRGESNWLEFAETLAVPILSTIAAQELASRVLAMRSPALAGNATLAAGLLYLVIGIIPVGIGLAAAGYIGTERDHEQVLSLFAQQYLSLPLYILFLGALVSAILSTLSGALLVAGSLAAHNIVLPLAPSIGDKAKLRLNRSGVVLFGLIAYVIALSSESVYSLVQESSSLGSAGVLVLILFSLWGGRLGGRVSAYAALLAGLATYVAAAHVFTWDYPYLTSVAAALVAYLACVPFKAPAPAERSR
ncbi:MAG: hypothetical protein HYZ32_05200, partial [Hydrocarboniphaga effusa]|nr:hypothetical protein [Hydrocarboniphaga effusa]